MDIHYFRIKVVSSTDVPRQHESNVVNGLVDFVIVPGSGARESKTLCTAD